MSSLEERVEHLIGLLEGRPDLLEESKELPSEMVIYFDPPIKGVMGKEHDAISLREPSVKEFKEAKARAKGKDDPDFEMGLVLIRLVSDTNDEVVGNMPVRKLMEAVEYVTGFFDAGRRTRKS